jgi:hypothetical protein
MYCGDKAEDLWWHIITMLKTNVRKSLLTRMFLEFIKQIFVSAIFYFKTLKTFELRGLLDVSSDFITLTAQKIYEKMHFDDEQFVSDKR